MAGKAQRPGYDALAGQVAELREQVRALKTENARLRTEMAELRRGDGTPVAAGPTVGSEPEPGSGSGSGQRKSPPRWAKANVAKAHVVRVAGGRPRAPRAPVPGRRREVPTQRLIHAPSACPQCAAALDRGRVVGRRQVLELPVAPVEVIEHVVLERRCRRCGHVCRGAMPELSAQVGAHRRVSWRIVALVAALRTTLRLPIRQLQWLLATAWGLRLSTGALCGLLDEAARAGRPAAAALLAEARASPAAHVDETGWRQDGRNGWVWTVTTPTTRVFRFVASRAGAVARDLLGTDYEGVVVSDFYTAYDQLDGRHQRCWAHFLREVHELKAQHPDHAGLHTWATAVHARYEQAVAWAATAQTRHLPEREAARLGFERALLARCRAEPARVPHAALCQRVERYHAEFFTFVAEPDVSPTNNAAERALRPLVIARKISGGTRSARGSQTRMRLQTLVASWDLRGLDPIAEFLTLLRAPSLPTPELAPV